MSTLIGERITRFWYGEKYVFERVAAGEWKLVSGDSRMIPASIIDDLPE